MSVTIKTAHEIELMREAGRTAEYCTQGARGGDPSGYLYLGAG